MPRLARYAAASALVLLLLALAGWMGRHWVASELARQADLDRLQGPSQPPRWSWDLRQPRQLLARRPFGPVTAGAGDFGLQLSATAPARYQLGLRLPVPVDLQHWPRMQLDYQAGFSLALSVIAVGPDRTACYSQDRLLPAGRRIELRLDRMIWQDALGHACMPGVATALRLTALSPPGRRWQLRRVALLPTAPVMAGPDLRLPAQVPAALAILAAAQHAGLDAAAPVVRLDPATSAAGMLRLRDASRLRWPGALLEPEAADARLADFRLPLPWCWLFAYALTLLVLWRCPPPPRQAWLEVVACLGGPLWLIVGMHFGRAPPGASAAATLLGLAYAGGLGWRQRAGWQWAGQTPGEWLRPLALLPLALLVAAGSGRSPGWPGTGHILAYLAWAAIQQALILTVVLPRLQRSLPRGLALPATAGCFMLLHTPNAGLMQLCLLAELYWAWCFQRDRRLLPVALGHALAALLIQSSLGPAGLVRSLEVSARFLN